MNQLPTNPEFATTFSDWVFKQTYPEAREHLRSANDHAERMRWGIDGHKRVIESLCRQQMVRERFGSHAVPDRFRIFYADTEADRRTFLASSLVIGGKAVRCRPDLILHHKAKDTYIVVEHKISSVKTRSWKKADGSNRIFESRGFPNNRAQLWCYSKIDDVQDSRLLLALQFWDHKTLDHKSTNVWTCPDSRFDAESRSWFERYCDFLSVGRTVVDG